jgi:hypothetical protein
MSTKVGFQHQGSQTILYHSPWEWFWKQNHQVSENCIYSAQDRLEALS